MNHIIDSLVNSTIAPLGASQTFTGGGETNGMPHVGVQCLTDAACTLYFDFSTDGYNWDSTFPSGGFKVAAGVSEFHTAVKMGRFFRLRLVNGSTPQTYLRLKTYFGYGFLPSALPLNQSAGLDQDAIFVRSTVPQDEIRIGRRTGVTGWTKFGYRSNLTAANGEETIWATTGNFTPMSTASTLTITYNAATDGADAGATGAQQLTFFYVDSSGLPATATHTLGSDGSDVTAFSGLGINRVAVSATGTNKVNVNAITITETTGATTQAVVPAGAGVTQHAIFFCGSNHDAVCKFLFINVNKISGGASPRVIVKGFVYNRAIDSRFEVFRYEIDTAVENHLTLEEPIGFNLSPTDVLYFVADTDTNATNVYIRFSLNEYQRS